MSKQYKTQKKSRKDKARNMRNWIIFTSIYIVFIGFLYGTATVYYPTPIQVGVLFMDLSIMIIILGLSLWAVISAFLLNMR